MEAFARLAPGQYQTGWVLNCVGRAYFETVDYPQAARCFAWSRQVVVGLVLRPSLNFNFPESDDLAWYGLFEFAECRWTPSGSRGWNCTAQCCGI